MDDDPLSLRRRRFERDDSDTVIPDPDAGRLLELLDEAGGESNSGVASTELDRDGTRTALADATAFSTARDAAVRSLNTRVLHMTQIFCGLFLPCHGIGRFTSLRHFLQQLSPQLRQWWRMRFTRNLDRHVKQFARFLNAGAAAAVDEQVATTAIGS
jgi:hypothetical protein